MVWKFNITTLGDYPLMCTIFITDVRNCVVGAKPMVYMDLCLCVYLLTAKGRTNAQYHQ